MLLCWRCCYDEDVEDVEDVATLKMLKMLLLWWCCYAEDVVTMKMLKMLLRWRCWRGCYIEGVAKDVATLRCQNKQGRFNKTSHKKNSGSYGCSRFARETWPGDCDKCPCTISQGSHERGAKHGTSRLFQTRKKNVRWQDHLQSFWLEIFMFNRRRTHRLGQIYIYICVCKHIKLWCKASESCTCSPPIGALFGNV